MSSRRLSKPGSSATAGGLTLVLSGLAQIGEASNCPGLKGFAGIAGVILDICNSTKTNKEECQNIIHDIGSLATAICNDVEENKDQLGPEFLEYIANMCSKLEAVQASLESLPSSRLSRMIKHSQDRIVIQRIQRDLKQMLDMFTVQFGASIERQALRMEMTSLRQQVELCEKIKDFSRAVLANAKRNTKEDPIHQGSVLPLNPRRFFGRTEEVEAVVRTLTGEGSGRVTILGPGGIGKTSLAVKVFCEDRVVSKFGDHRYFVACDAATSKEDLVSAVASTLKIQGVNIQKRVMDFFQLAEQPSLLVLDNFEEPWEPVASKAEVETLLSMISSISSVSLLVTMRGAERPGKVSWTRPFLPQLKPLSLAAARETFLALSNCPEDDPNVDKLVTAVDNVPLPVTLMAALAQVEKTEVLLQRWEEEQSSLLHRTPDRRDSLDISIQVSLDSPRMQAVPEAMELLRLLSLLPDGVDSSQLDAIFPHFKQSRKALSTLWQTSLACHHSETRRTCVLSPIRSYMNTHSKPDAIHLEAMMTYYLGLCRMSSEVGGLAGRTIMKRLSPEIGNLHAIVNLAISPKQADSTFLVSALRAAIDLSKFWRYTWLGNTETLRRAAQVAEKIDDKELQAEIHFRLSWASWLEKLKESETLCLKALGLYEECGNLSGQADCYWLHGQILKNTPRQKECQGLYERGIELSKQSGNRYTQGKCLSTLSEVMFYKGDVERSEGYSQEALSIFRGLDPDVAATNIGVSLYWLGYLASSQSNTTLALAYFADAISVLEQTGACLWVGHALGKRGDLLRARCDFEAAQKCYEKAAVLFGDQGALHSSIAAYTHIGLAEVAAALQDWEKSQEYVDLAWKAFQGTDRIHGIFFTQILQANIKFYYRREYAEAEGLYSTALASCRTAGYTEEEALCNAQLGLVHASCSRFANALRSYITALALFSKMSNSRRKAGVMVKIADLYQANGEASTARSVYLAVYPLSYRLESYRDAADALLGIGSIEGSRPCLEAAMKLYEKTGDKAGTKKCKNHLEGVNEKYGPHFVLQGEPAPC